MAPYLKVLVVGGRDVTLTKLLGRGGGVCVPVNKEAKCPVTGDPFEEEDRMIPLHEDPWFTFQFVDDRIIPRFHLEGIEAGRRVNVYKIDPGTGKRRDLLASATVGAGGWVDLTEPILVRSGGAFIAVPEPPS